MTDDCSYREGHLGVLSWHEGLTIHPPSHDARLFCVALLPSPSERGRRRGEGGAWLWQQGEIMGRQGSAGQCGGTIGMGFQSEPCCELAV